ncbi:MAG: hypothetical protein ACRER1_06045 [Gammaproteobacteria bacterium]
MMKHLNHTHQLLLAGAIGFLIASGGALASGTPAAASTSKADQAIWLSPLVVYGHKIPMPVALQIIKGALKRHWSSAREDRNVLVCTTPQRLGTHLETLRCQTNEQHYREAQETQLHLAQMNQHAPLNVEVANWVNNHRTINVSVLRHLLSKLPSADASYTLQVKDHGKIVTKYEFKKGKLVNVWHSDKQTGRKSSDGNR